MSDNSDLYLRNFLKEFVDDSFDFVSDLVYKDIHGACGIKGDVDLNLLTLFRRFLGLNWFGLLLHGFRAYGWSLRLRDFFDHLFDRFDQFFSNG